MLNGYKTYAGGIGLILVGIGGILHGDSSIAVGLTSIAGGLIAVGFRSFGQKVLDLLKTLK